MKKQMTINQAAAAIILSAAVYFSPNSQAGIIDMLRGSPEPAAYQRVAFVGGAEVKQVRGEAEKLIGVDVWAALERGAQLQPGDLVRVRNGNVVLKMRESGSLVKITPNTRLRLTGLPAGWDRAALSGREERSGFAVRACRGQAQFREDSGEWQKVQVNTVVPEGALVKMQPGTVLDLYSTAEMRALRLEGQTEAKLTAGLFAPKPAISVAAR